MISRSAPPTQPPLPSQYQSNNKHNSVDYLESESGSNDPYDVSYEEQHRGRHQFPLDSPASSSHEYFAAGPVMGSAQKVDIQRTASSALAEIIGRKQMDVVGGGGGRYI